VLTYIFFFQACFVCKIKSTLFTFAYNK
jgi:hypothetical protein